jgi:hypothetical protein
MKHLRKSPSRAGKARLLRNCRPGLERLEARLQPGEALWGPLAAFWWMGSNSTPQTSDFAVAGAASREHPLQPIAPAETAAPAVWSVATGPVSGAGERAAPQAGTGTELAAPADPLRQDLWSFEAGFPTFADLLWQNPRPLETVPGNAGGLEASPLPRGGIGGGDAASPAGVGITSADPAGLSSGGSPSAPAAQAAVHDSAMQWVNHYLAGPATTPGLGVTPGKPLGHPGAPSPAGPGGHGSGGPDDSAIRSGFDTTSLGRGDDHSSPEVPLGFTISFFCSTPHTGVFVNNNGNITFGSALGQYTPPPLNTLGQDIIAPFFADVDTRDPGSGITAYGQGTVDGHPAFGATWINVGYYNMHSSPTDSFQAILISRTDVGPLDFDIELNYGHLNWETGDASGGIGGLGGNSARAGYSIADGSHSIELPGSAVNGALLDGGPNALIASSQGSDVLGRYVFQVRNTDCLDIDQIKFNGTGNVPIRIDETTTIGTPGDPSGPDVQWVRGQRDQPNTTAPWDTTQSAPAAFIRNNPLHAEVMFHTMIPGVTSMVVSASSTSGYGNIPNTTVTVTGGMGTANVTSTQSLDHVDFNDVTFMWHLESVTVGGQTISTNSALLHQTTHRIYTLFANPDQAGFEPMRQPWATVLELATSLAFARSTDTTVVEDLTRGIHYSSWRTYAPILHFVNAQATLIYDPTVLRTALTGPVGNRFSRQRYDLTNFMSFMSQAQNIQQCNDNANLLSIFARSLGVNVTPKWVANNPNTVLMRPTRYYPAGSNTQTPPIRFTFHQVGFYNNMVYDASTRPNVTGDPNMGVTLPAYMNSVFGYTDASQYRTLDVSTITIGSVDAAPQRLTSIDTTHSSVGTRTTVTVTGAGITAATRVVAVESDYSAAAAGVTIENRTVVDSGTIRFDVVIDAGAMARGIKVLVGRPGVEMPGDFDYTIDP